MEMEAQTENRTADAQAKEKKDFTDVLNKFNSCRYRIDFISDFFRHTKPDESVFLSEYSIFGLNQIFDGIKADLKDIGEEFDKIWLDGLRRWFCKMKEQAPVGQ